MLSLCRGPDAQWGNTINGSFRSRRLCQLLSIEEEEDEVAM